jgi:hypothetical protein
MTTTTRSAAGANAPLGNMKTLALFAALLAACSAPPETPGIATPPGMVHPYTGQKVEEIARALTYDASVRVTKHLTYNANWDGVLGGAFASSAGNPRVDPANQLSCPSFWVSVWRQDDPGVVYAWYYASAAAVTIGRADIPPPDLAPIYTKACDYEFRNGGSGPAFPYIPVNHGNLLVSAWPTCPNIAQGISGVSAFNPQVFSVAAGESKTLTLASGYGPYGWKSTWASVAQQCGMPNAGDSRWNSPTTLGIHWCEATGSGCLPNSNHDIYATW